MRLSTIGQIALPVGDADRSEVFYGTALGLRKLFRAGSLVFFDCAGVRLMLQGSAKEVHVTPGVCHYFKVDDIEAAAANLAANGVNLEGEPHIIATMPDHVLWMAFFRDPDGHMLALMEERR